MIDVFEKIAKRC